MKLTYYCLFWPNMRLNVNYFNFSVAYVSRSGGMSNELNNMICRATDGVYEGVAIGGDRYPGTTFVDHILRYNDTEDVKLIVMLGEVGKNKYFNDWTVIICCNYLNWLVCLS